MPEADATLKTTIRRLAHEHGFDACHFSLPVLKARDKQGLKDWLAHQYQADMAWMAEPTRLQRRLHPDSMLDDVKTVISLAMRHTPPKHDLSDIPATCGVVASYAYGVDYHTVMKKRLKALARDLDALLGEHGQRVFVDTAPVLEHALAASSGLGWQGKHSLTIHRQYGSYMMLGEIFTTAAIAPDDEASLHCGTCTACLDICPTAAIVAPYVVDARRCISYLTIEYKGWIARELRPLMGAHIYGCDDCQMVCPWNRKLTACEQDLLKVNPANILPELSAFLQLDDEGFRLRFRQSPVKRTGREAFLRNVCIAMGNSGEPELIPFLLQVLEDDSALLRGHALWALHRLMANDAAWEAVAQRLEVQETDVNVLREIAECRQERLASSA